MRVARRRPGAPRRGGGRRRDPSRRHRGRAAARRRRAGSRGRACRCSRRPAARPTGRSSDTGSPMTKVSLSRPLPRELPIATPSQGPGLPRSSRSARTPARRLRRARAARGSARRSAPRGPGRKRERRVASADVRVVLEDMPEPCCVASSTSELPGSVIAMNCSPLPPVSEWKYSNSESVSIVPPDFVETTKSACSSSICVLHRKDRVGVGRVEHVQVRARPWAAPNVRQSTSGARLDPPIPSSTASLKFSPTISRAKATSPSALLEHRVGDLEPAQAIGDLGHARTAPERLVLLPDAPRDLLVDGACATRCATAPESSCGIEAEIACGPAGEHPLARALDPGQQLVHRRHERRDALVEQRLRHVVMSIPPARAPRAARVGS